MTDQRISKQVDRKLLDSMGKGKSIVNYRKYCRTFRLIGIPKYQFNKSRFLYQCLQKPISHLLHPIQAVLRHRRNCGPIILIANRTKVLTHHTTTTRREEETR